MPELMDYLRHCETWAAALLEGQLSFPVLAFYRSHHDSHSWLATLCAIMDTCAVLLTGVEGGRSFQPRMTFAVGRMAILEMANIMQLSPVPPPADRLSSEAYQDITATLKAAGLPWEGGDAEMKLAELRSTYEPYLYAIATYLVLPVPGWSPSAAPDNWQRGDHGKLARELIDTAEAVTQNIDRIEKRDDTAGDRSSRHS